MVPVLPCGSHSALPQVFLSRSFCLTSRMVRRQSSIPRRLCQDFNCRSRCDSTGDMGKQPITQRSGGALQNGTYLVLSLVNCREPSEWCPDRKRSLPTCCRSLAGCAAQILLASVPRSSAYSEVKDHGPMAPAISPAPKTLFAPAERPLSLSKSAVLVCFHTQIG